MSIFDGEAGRVALKGAAYANGINVSANGETIYLVELLKRKIAVLDRNKETGTLTRRKAIKVNTAPDNIEVAEDGSLWTGGHSRIFEFLDHAKDETAVAPSHVVRIDPETGKTRDIFISTGGEINAVLPPLPCGMTY